VKILAVETATMLGGVAIADDSTGLIAEVRLNVKSTHSERLMSAIDHLLNRSGLAVSDIDAFAVSAGPGSFTGLRIGLSTVKGFSCATRRPIVSVPTLEAFVWNFLYCPYPVCTLLDARKKEVYAALFRWQGNTFVRTVSEISTRIDKLPPILGEITTKRIRTPHENGHESMPDQKILFAGEGALLYRQEIQGLFGEKALFAPLEKMVPSPSNVASIGMKKALQGEFSEPVSLVPIYIRRSEAELKQDE
jgi:tRNA threonylcarbamoyladenosine biosynthesis protein TsaB